MANEETIMNGNMQNANVATNAASAAGSVWKSVTIGGVSGILMGAGSVLGFNAHAAEKAPELDVDKEDEGVVISNDKDGAEEAVAEAAAEVAAEEAVEPSVVDESVQQVQFIEVANVSDDMSFGEAFAAARAEVGPGGVFYWHGAIFNTYYAEEWAAMSDKEKLDFAQQLQPAVPVDDVVVDDIETAHVTIVHHEGVVEHHHFHHHDDNAHAAGSSHQATARVDNTDGPDMSGFDMDGVRIVGQAETDDGHVVVAYDATGDNEADFALVDVDNDLRVSGDDVLVTPEGDMITVAELQEISADEMAMDGDQLLAQNPDVAEDGMPDYMDDGIVEA